MSAGGGRAPRSGPERVEAGHRRRAYYPPAPSTVTEWPSSRTSAARALGLLLAGDPERDRAGAHVRRRVQRHVLDVHAGLAERQRQLGDRPRAVGDDEPQLVQRAAAALGLEQPAAVLAGRGVPGGDRLAVAAADQRRRLAAAARDRRRPRRRPPRGCRRRCRPRSPGWRRRRGSRRGSSGRPRAAARPCSARPPPRATSALASTCGRWLTAAISRSWAAGVDRLRPGAERRRRCAAGGRRAGRSERSVGVRYQRAPWKRSARAFSTPAVSAPASGWPPTKRSSSPSAATSSRLVEPTSVTTRLRAAGRERRARLLGQRRRPAPAQKTTLGALEAAATESAARSSAPSSTRPLQPSPGRGRSPPPRRRAAAARRARSSRRSGRRRGRRSSSRRPPLSCGAPRPRRRAAPAPSTVSSQSMQASVIDWP